MKRYFSNNRMINRLMAVVLLLIVVAGAAGCAESYKNAEPLTGLITREQLEDAPGWKKAFDQEYTQETEVIRQLAIFSSDMEAIVFLNTTHEDSVLEVPKFYQIVDVLGVSADQIQLVGLGNDGKDPDGLANALQVTGYPTFIIVVNGYEQGRIVQHPTESMEADLLKILNPMR